MRELFPCKTGRQGQADGLGEALAERPGTDLHPGGLVHVGMALQVAAETAKRLQVVPGKITGFGQADIEGRGSMSLGKDETVAVLPSRVAGVVAHGMEIERGQYIDGRKAATGMPRPGKIEHLENFHAQVPGSLFKVPDGLFGQHLKTTPICFRVVPCGGTIASRLVS
jgi:hypothetical protein